MTHDQYLEKYHELTTKVLPDVAMRLGQSDFAAATDLLTRLRAKQDDLWSQRVVTAQQGKS